MDCLVVKSDYYSVFLSLLVYPTYVARKSTYVYIRDYLLNVSVEARILSTQWMELYCHTVKVSSNEKSKPQTTDTR